MGCPLNLRVCRTDPSFHFPHVDVPLGKTLILKQVTEEVRRNAERLAEGDVGPRPVL